jgi:hypothetical protein
MVAINDVFQMDEGETRMRKLKTYNVGFVVAGSIMTILFLIIVNMITSFQHLWFIYPTFALLLSLFSIMFIKNKMINVYSILSSMLIMIFLFVQNFLYTPEYPWFLYTVPPLVVWPILMLLGPRAKTMATALIGSTLIILYYVLLNLLLSPQYPWAIYPIFVVLWWPLSLYHVKKKTYFKFSLSASLLLIAFFITVNAVSTPNEIWAVYPIFCVLWWPLSMYYFYYKRKMDKGTDTMSQGHNLKG